MAMHLRQVEAENQSQALAEAGPFSPAFPDFPRSVAYPKETWSKKGQNMAIEWLSHVLLVIFLTPGGDLALNLAGWWWLSGDGKISPGSDGKLSNEHHHHNMFQYGNGPKSSTRWAQL